MRTRIEGTFIRMSPAAFAEKVAIPLGWFVISHHFMPEKIARRRAHGRWYRIDNGSYSVYRILRFSPNLTYDPRGTSQIVLDWVGWLDVSGRVEDVDGSLSLTVTEVPIALIPFMVLKHPDPIFRLMGWLAYLSLLLGIIAVAVG